MILSVENVIKDFDGLRAVNGASLHVNEGEIVGLIGPNGSGKSTLINVISGLAPATGGSIRFNNHDITRASPEEIFERGIVRGYQNPSLFFQMTVLDNALLPAKRQKGEHPWYAPWKRSWQPQEAENAGFADRILRQLNLRHQFRKPSADLSGGQMKLAELARALMGDPRLLLLDEPTAGVAPSLAYSIFEQIERLRRETGMSFLIVEHRLEMLFDFVDRVYVLHMGSVLAEGTPGEIIDNASVREVYFGD
jgi:branched-chain amino acid transport system ATP-binding protein